MMVGSGSSSANGGRQPRHFFSFIDLLAKCMGRLQHHKTVVELVV